MSVTTNEAELSGLLAGPVELYVNEGFRDPLGFHDAMPVFSWQLPVRGGARVQQGYRVVAATQPELLPNAPDLWDSGPVASGQSVCVPYKGQPINSRQKAYWQVQFTNEEGRESAWSAPASFELGLLHNEDWQAKWIGLDASARAAEGFVPEYLRREFAVDGGVRQARLYATAKGLFEVHLNGEKVGRDWMVPGWTSYAARLETLTYDVTAQLSEGTNALGVVLGEGWYAGTLMCKEHQWLYPEAQPAVLLQLEICYTDGRVQTVGSDHAWKVTDAGPIRSSGIYQGETYDAGKEMPGWDAPGFDAAAWQPVIAEPVASKPALVPKRHPAVRAMAELPTTAVTQPQPGRFVFDLGQNMVGWARLNIPVRTGETITVRFAEMLESDGTLYTKNYRAAKSTDTYTAGVTDTITWQPTFTFPGFRYVELTGFPEGTNPDPSWLTGIVLHSHFASSGTFTSSHAKLNKLQANIRWGQRGNFLDIPTDCPQRNERLGWTGDAQVFCATSIFNYNVHAFWMSWLQSLRDEQTPAGLIPHVVPNTNCGEGSPGWGDACVTIPWNVYVRTGDMRVLEENYEMMQKWVAAYEREAEGFIVSRKGYGDWLQPHPECGDLKGDTPMDLIGTAYFGYCAALTGKAALILGHKDDADAYAKQLAGIRAAFSERFFDTTGRLTTEYETQTGYLMALDYDLLEPDLRDGAVRNLLRKIDDAEGNLRTGFLGTPLIAPVLDREGHTAAAYAVVFKETNPSWFFSIDQGATTMWERWNSYSHADGFGDAGMNSFNHYAYGAIGQWMVERIAGLAPDPESPGYKHVLVQPVPGGPLTYAKAELQTPYGRTSSGWEKTAEGLVVRAVIPPNTTATLVVPATGTQAPTVLEAGVPCALLEREGNRVYDFGPGEHVFTIR